MFRQTYILIIDIPRVFEIAQLWALPEGLVPITLPTSYCCSDAPWWQPASVRRCLGPYPLVDSLRTGKITTFIVKSTVHGPLFIANCQNS